MPDLKYGPLTERETDSDLVYLPYCSPDQLSDSLCVLPGSGAVEEWPKKPNSCKSVGSGNFMISRHTQYTQRCHGH